MKDSVTIYICVEHDENPGQADVHCTFTDLSEYLEDFNQCMETDYSTLEEFNETEEFRTIYKSEIKKSDL